MIEPNDGRVITVSALIKSLTDLVTRQPEYKNANVHYMGRYGPNALHAIGRHREGDGIVLCHANSFEVLEE